MNLLKLAYNLDRKGSAEEIDHVDKELFRIAQEINSTNPQPSQSEQIPVGDMNTGMPNTSLPTPNSADTQIYDQLAKHILTNKKEHVSIYTKLRELEEKLYNLEQGTTPQ